MTERPSDPGDGLDGRAPGRAVRGSGRVSMRDVARLAGVSHITVSRVLQRPAKVAESTRLRVARAIEESGYIPNLVAGSLSSNRTRIIAAVVPSLRSSVAADFTEGLSDILDRNGFHVLIGSSRVSVEEEESLVRAFLARRVEGIYLYGGTHSEATRRLLRSARVPTVEVGMLPERPIDMAVGHSDVAAARDLTTALIARGYRRIAFVSFTLEDNLRESERLRGYLAALREAGLDDVPGRRLALPFDIRSGARAMAALLERQPEVDAVFFSSDMLAAGGLAECHRRDVPVPERVAIAGYGDFDLATLVHPPLTTVRTPRYQIGARAAQMLLDRLSGKAVEPRVVDMGYEIVLRESV